MVNEMEKRLRAKRRKAQENKERKRDESLYAAGLVKASRALSRAGFKSIGGWSLVLDRKRGERRWTKPIESLKDPEISAFALCAMRLVGLEPGRLIARGYIHTLSQTDNYRDGSNCAATF